MFGFLIALVAGYLVPHVERPLGEPVARLLKPIIAVTSDERRLLTFMIMLLGAGVVSSLFDSGTAFWITAGVCLGYFGTRIIAAVQKLLSNRAS